MARKRSASPGIVRQRRARRLDRGAHRRQRRAQLVGHVGHEVLADRLEPPDLGHVHQHHQRARALPAQRGRVHQQPAGPGPIDGHLARGGLLPLPGSARRWRPGRRCGRPPAASGPPGGRRRGSGGPRRRWRTGPPTAAAPGRPGWPSRMARSLPTTSTPSSMASRIRSRRSRSSRSARKVALRLSASWSRVAASWPISSVVSGRMRTSRLPRAICRATPAIDCSERPIICGGQGRQQHRHHQRQQRAAQQQPAQPRDRLLDLGQRQGRAAPRRVPPAHGGALGQVQHGPIDGGAEAHAGSAALSPGPPSPPPGRAWFSTAGRSARATPESPSTRPSWAMKVTRAAARAPSSSARRSQAASSRPAGGGPPPSPRSARAAAPDRCARAG